MTPIAAYLNFDGNCREAMHFYQRCLGGELEVMTFGTTEFSGGFEAPRASRTGSSTPPFPAAYFR